METDSQSTEEDEVELSIEILSPGLDDEDDDVPEMLLGEVSTAAHGSRATSGTLVEAAHVATTVPAASTSSAAHTPRPAHTTEATTAASRYPQRSLKRKNTDEEEEDAGEKKDSKRRRY